MPTARITKRSVDMLTPVASDIFLWDELLKGFGLRLTSKGARSYVVQYHDKSEGRLTVMATFYGVSI